MQRLTVGWLPRGGMAKFFWLVILAGAALLRFEGLDREGFWVDEIFSARIVEYPWNQVLDHIPTDKPPLDYYIQKALGRFGVPEFWHRLHSALAGVALALAVFAWARVWFGSVAALAAFLLAALSPLLLYYAQEARPYSLFCALATAQNVLLAVWWRRAAARHDQAPAAPGRVATGALWTACFLLGLVAMFTLYAALVVFAAQMAFLLLAAWLAVPGRRGRARLAWRATWPILLAVGLTVALAWPLKARAQLHPSVNVYWRFVMDGPAFWRHLGEIFVHTPFGWPAHAATAAAVALALLGAAESWRRSRAGALQIMTLSLAVPAAMVALYAWIDRGLFTRYFIFAVPGLLILVALGLERLGAWLAAAARRLGLAPRPAALTLGLAVCFALPVCLLDRSHRPYRLDWRGLARHIAQNSPGPDRAIVPSAPDRVTLRYYLDRLGRPDIEVQDQTQRADDTRQGATWTVRDIFGREKALKSPFYGLLLERLGTGPDPARLAELARAVGDPPTLMVGKCPTELLGDGWDPPETWGPDFIVRWVTRRRTPVFLPLTRPGAGRLVLNLMPYKYPGAPPQGVSVTFEGRTLERRELPTQFTRLEWPVPAGVARAGLNRVELHFDWVHSPSAEKRNYADFRTLAAAVRSLEWLPAEP